MMIRLNFVWTHIKNCCSLFLSLLCIFHDFLFTLQHSASIWVTCFRWILCDMFDNCLSCQIYYLMPGNQDTHIIKLKPPYFSRFIVSFIFCWGFFPFAYIISWHEEERFFPHLHKHCWNDPSLDLFSSLICVAEESTGRIEGESSSGFLSWVQICCFYKRQSHDFFVLLSG